MSNIYKGCPILDYTGLEREISAVLRLNDYRVEQGRPRELNVEF